MTKGETDEPSALPITPPDDFTDPRDTIETLRKLSVLDFVCPDSKNISTYQADKTAFLSQRKPFPGMGIISSQEDVTSPTAGLLFNHYLVNHFGCFLSPEGGDGLQYPLEQILMNQNNDYDNLKAVVNRLLLIREGLNIAAIESEPALKSQMQACASTLAALLVLPALEPLIEAFLTAGWAYCESLLDVRTLLSGDKIPTIKNAENWQVALNNLPALLTDPNELKKPAAKGLSYQNYLSILLLTRPAANKTVGAMDMIEHEIRHKVNPDFRFDLCLDSVTAEITATTSDDISLTAERSISYRDM